MFSSVEFLWRLNREYVNRVVKARNYLGLLEYLILKRGAAETQAQVLMTLQFARAHLTQLTDEHRGWCYAYFYESAETKRMVQTPEAVHDALVSFRRMREQHQDYLHELHGKIVALPRPESNVTHVPNGDLWEMVRAALHDLIELDRSLRN